MSYALSGKIAGFGASRGFGDAASTYAGLMVAYQNDHATWLNEQAAYTRAAMGYSAAKAGLASGYAAAQAGYTAQLAAWNAQTAARSAALVAINRQNATNAKANAAARAQGVVLPAGYPGCVSQAQHNSWQAGCATISTTVKGLGVDASPSGPLCSLARLPVCGPPVAIPPDPGPKPAPPAPPVLPAPPPPLRPEPMPPAPPPALTAGPAPSPATPATPNSPLGPAPASITTVSPDPSASNPDKTAGLIKNGLILVVIAGGSYALYRTFKKPKAS